MTFEPGTRLGPYELVELLGQGGMGAVYRANDTRLDRAVALKVLAGDLTEDADRRARFEREARTVAALSHPNICTLFDVGKSDDVDYLVMELVEGQSLDRSMAEGVSVADAIGIAREISLALEVAHAAGVVHRDLKPANVMVCGRSDRSAAPGASVKVLDFGLAKAWEPTPSTPALADSPTLTARMTGAGVILGTAAYMSPEQARGQEADPRADIWAWGVILFEMLSRRQLFTEPTVSDTLAAVLRSEIPWDRLPDDTPVRVREVLEQCLERDRDRRFHAMADARLELERAEPIVEQPTSAATGGRSLLQLAGWVIAALAMVAWLWTLWGGAGPAARPMSMAWSFDVELPASFETPQISPDGTHLVASATGPLQLRAVASREWTSIPGTDGATEPFWSPDSSQVAFFQGSELKRVSLDGTLPERVAEVPVGPIYGHWANSGDILIEPSASALSPNGEGSGGWMLLRAGAATFERIRDDRPEMMSPDRTWPQILPDGEHVLFTEPVDGVAMLQVVPLAGGAARPLTRAQSRAVYVDPGFVLYVLEGRLFAVRFDLAELEITGTPVQIASRIRFLLHTGTADFSVSRGGALVYDSGPEPSRLTWVGRQGQVIGTVGQPALFETLEISADGDRLVTEVKSPETGTDDLWLFDLGRGVGSRLTSRPRSEILPVWSPDGRRIAYGADVSGPPNLFVLDVESGTSRELTPFDHRVHASTSWSPDGRHLLHHRRGAESGTLDLWLFDFESGDAAPWLESPFSMFDGKFSPDGRWVSYVSTESGAPNVFLRPFPGPGRAIPVSDPLGMDPRWSADGSELYFRGSLDDDVDDLALIAVSVGPGSPPRIGEPEILFPLPSPDYVPAASGERFLTLRSDRQRHRIQVLLDWTRSMGSE